jgi:G3E family GTPase
VTLVDAAGFRASRSLSPAVDEQVRHGDVLILTKRDLVPDEVFAATHRAVRALAPDAPILVGGIEDAVRWLERVITDPFAGEVVRQVVGHRSQESGLAPDDHGHDHAAGEGHAHGIDSVWAPIGAVLDLEELEDRLAALPGHYIRIKGVARAVDGRIGEIEPRWYAFHRVGLRVSSEPIAPAGSARAVALGPGVEAGPLAACIEAAVISSDDGATG